MNKILESAGYPAPDKKCIEEIFATIQPVPGKNFYQKMQDAPWQAARKQKGKSTMKTKIAFSTLAFLLLLTALVVFVPPVKAQVSEWFSIVIHDPNNGSSVGVSGNSPMMYRVMQPGYLPKVLSDGRTIAKFGEVTEILYKNEDNFLILTQMAAVDGENLPKGVTTKVKNVPAVLNEGLSGKYEELPDKMSQSDGGGVAIAEAIVNPSPQDTTNESLTFDYTNAIKLTFITDNIKVELLSNLPVDEILKIAEKLAPAS